MKRLPIVILALFLICFEACKTTEEDCLPRKVTPCPDQPAITYEGQTYNTVLIGNQCWMAENLNVGFRIDGYFPQSNNGVIQKYCYADLDHICDIYGGLYQWGEMMNYDTTEGGRGICPEGWHVPTHEEWLILEGTVDSRYGIGDVVWDDLFNWRGYDAGKNLKSTTRWQEDGNGCDIYGFNALPGGGHHTNQLSYGFDETGRSCHFWTSKELWYRGFSFYYDKISLSWQGGGFLYAYSVRCIKDE